jgi:hypothetical protein
MSVFAAVTRPIVTDYVPAVKPPWLLLALLGLILCIFPRELLPTALMASAAVILSGALLNWLWDRFRHPTDELVGKADSLGGADEIPR